MYKNGFLCVTLYKNINHRTSGQFLTKSGYVVRVDSSRLRLNLSCFAKVLAWC